MKPQHVKVKSQPDTAVSLAAQAVRKGGMVVFPTETFYGLGVNPFDAQAVKRLVALKGRDPHKPIAVIIAPEHPQVKLPPLPSALKILCEAFWPGPLTVLVETAQAGWTSDVLADVPADALADILGAADGRIGLRISSHPIAQRLAAEAGGWITATSANRSHQPPAAAVEDLDPGLYDQVDVVLDAGRLEGSEPSTVVMAQGHRVKVVRSGAVSREALGAVLGYRLEDACR